MDDKTQIEQGSKIIKSVYKASIKALFAIGVKSPEYVDKFTLNFSQELDREFLKIGLFEKPLEGTVELVAPDIVVTRSTYPPLGDKNGDIKQNVTALGLNPVIVSHLKRANILTIEELMTIMQKDSLTTIRGIAEKSAKEILTKFAQWNTHY